MTTVASISTVYLLLLIGLGLFYFPRQRLRRGEKRTLESEKYSKSADKNDFDPNERREMGDPAIMNKAEFTKPVLCGFLFRPRNMPMIGAAFPAFFLPVLPGVFSNKPLMPFNRWG